MDSDGIKEAAEAAGKWLAAQRFGSSPPSAAMEAWFRSMASVCYQVESQLRLVRLDGSVTLEPSDSVACFLRFDLFHGLLAILEGEGYGWTDALEEFCDPIWRRRRSSAASDMHLRATGLGPASSQLASAIAGLIEGFRQAKDWEWAGEQMRLVFLLVCRQLILVEIELARIGELEQESG